MSFRMSRSSLLCITSSLNNDAMLAWHDTILQASEHFPISLLGHLFPIHEHKKQINRSLSQRDRELLASFHHEQDHALRMLSSTYGLMYCYLDSLFFTMFAREQVQQLRQQNVDWLSSVHRITEYPRRDDTFDDLKFLSSAVEAIQVQRIFEGVNIPQGSDSLCGINALVALQRLCNPNAQEPQVAFRPELGQHLASPQCQKSPFGGRSIMENCAHFINEQELTLLDLQPASIDLSTRLMNNTDVAQAQFLWLTSFSGLPNGLDDRGDKLDAFEFLWCLELALCVPFGPNGFVDANCKPTNVIKWHDIHPGWRYVRILDLLKQTSYRFLPDRYPRSDAYEIEIPLKNWICEVLGWPKQLDLANTWVDYWEGIGPQNTLDQHGELYGGKLRIHPRARLGRFGMVETLYNAEPATRRFYDKEVRSASPFPFMVSSEGGFIGINDSAWETYEHLTGNSVGARLRDFATFELPRQMLGMGYGNKAFVKPDFSETICSIYSNAARERMGLSEEEKEAIFNDSWTWMQNVL